LRTPHDAVVTSTDSRERAAEAKEKWGLPNLTVGYGVGIEKAREWNLYILGGRGPTSAGVEERPFARPHFPEIAAAIDFAVSKNYPARGEA